jgi:hypothetical protein
MSYRPTEIEWEKLKKLSDGYLNKQYETDVGPPDFKLLNYTRYYNAYVLFTVGHLLGYDGDITLNDPRWRSMVGFEQSNSD